MLTINNIFDIAESAMTTNQTAMNTVSQNVANANTPFYNSETPIITEAPAVVGEPYTYGTGVNVSHIQRNTNDFVQSEVNGETTLNSYYTTLYQGLDQIQNLFNDQSGSGFSSAISKFFNDFQNVANDPSNAAQRTALLSDANSLSGNINNAYTAVMDMVSSTNTSIKGAIPEINNLADRIASLNKQVTYAQNAGGNANELRDERMNSVNALSKLVNISYYKNNSGKINISMGNAPIVIGDSPFSLSTHIDSSNPSALDVMWNGPDGSTQSVTKNITGGSLGAYINLEHVAAPSYIKQLNSLSASIADNVNSLQHSGYGLGGSTGNYFFNPDLATAVGTNTVTNKTVTDAIISTGYITDPSKLTGNNYTVSTTGGGTFTVKNTTTGQTLSSSEVSVSSKTDKYGQSVYTIDFGGVSVNITGTSTGGAAPKNGDTFIVNQLTTDPAFTMAVNPNLSTSQVAAASAVATAVGPDNAGNATISAGSVINPTDVTDGTAISNSNNGGQYGITYVSSDLSSAAASGATTITINGNFQNNLNTRDNFLPGQQILIGSTGYDVSSASGSVVYDSTNNTTNITLSSGLTKAYSSGTVVSAFSVKNKTTGETQYLSIPPTVSSLGQNDYSIFFGNQNNIGSTVSARNFHVQLTGTPSNGDSFTANVISPRSDSTPSIYATNMTLSQMKSIGLDGNNENALNIGSLQNNNVPINGVDTPISTYYSGIVSNIGTQAQSTHADYTNSTSVISNLQNQLQSFVGVNMNRQMTDLVNYQNSYQAAAAITHSVEAIMTALLSIVP